MNEETGAMFWADRPIAFGLVPKFLEIIPDGALAVSPGGRILSMNTAAESMFGYSRAELVGRPIETLVPTSYSEAHQRHVAGFFASDGVFRPMDASRCVRARRKDGSEFPVSNTLRKIATTRGVIVIAASRDMTEMQRMQDELAETARLDSLTGLLNRKALMESLDLAIARSSRQVTSVAFLYIDLDGFKEMNDSFGHEFGDQLLVEVSTRIGGTTRRGDIAGRLGGDEFGVVLEDLSINDSPDVSARRLTDVLGSSPYCVAGHTVSLGASVGIACYPDDAQDARTLINVADEAMYKAKKLGGGCVSIGGSGPTLNCL